MTLYDREVRNRLHDAEFVRERLRAECANSGSQREWARANGVSPQFVCEVLMGRKEPSPAVLEPLGLQREVYYTVFFGPAKKRSRVRGGTNG